MLILVMTAASALFVYLTVILIASVVNREKNRLESRLSELMGHEEKPLPPSQKKQLQKRRLTVSRVFAEQLLSAGIRMRPEEFLSFWLFCAIVPGVILIFAGGHIITLLAVAALGVLVPPLLVLRAKKKRIVLFEKQLGDSLLLMGNCLKSGLSFLQSMSNIAKEMPDPIAREFSRAVKEIRLGSSMDEALGKMVQRMPSTDLMLLVSAVQIQRQAGGNLLEILENISAAIKDRIKLKEDIRVMTSSGRTRSLIIGMLPIIIAIMLMVINPGYIQTFFKTTMGIGLLVTAAVMETIGFMVINKMVTIKF